MKKKALQLLALVTLNACGAQYDFETRHGLLVSDETGSFSQDDIETLTELTIREVGAGRKVIKGLEVVFKDFDKEAMAECDCDGYTKSSSKRIVMFKLSECIAHTALVHELTHVIMARTGFDMDHDHESGLWEQVADLEKDTVEVMCD